MKTTSPHSSSSSIHNDSNHFAQRALEHCKYLSTEIGPRPATQNGERQAATYFRQKLESYGAHRVHEELLLSARATYRPFTLALCAGLAANLLNSSVRPVGRIRRIIAAFAAVSGATGFAREANLQPNWMRRMLGTGDSQNIVGIVPANGQTRRRVVIYGHLDSHRTPIFYSHPTWLRLFSHLIALAFGSLLVGALVHAASTCRCAARADGARKTKKIAAAIQSIAIALTLQAETSPHTGGANDNASGAATVLALAERLTLQPLEHTEVWIVGTGCEEVGAYGIAAFLRRHSKELQDAYFLNFDMCGIGSPALLTREGLLTKRDADPHLLAMAHQVWAQDFDLLGGAHQSDAYTDTSVVTQNGFAGLTIDAIIPAEHPAASRLGFWHQMDDKIENIELDALAKTQEFAWQMLQRIEQENEVSVGKT